MSKSRKLKCRIVLRGVHGDDVETRFAKFQHDLLKSTKGYLKLESGSVVHEDSDCIVEFPAHVKVLFDDDKFADSLLIVMNMLNDAVEQARERTSRGNELMASVVVLSKDIYPHDFKMKHVFEASNFSYGNVHNNGIFTKAFKTVAQTDKMGWLATLLPVDLNCNMCIIFDHHRKDVYVYFPHGYVRKNGNADRRIVCLKLPYSSIKQIMIGVWKVREGWEIDFTFHTSCSPIILLHTELKAKGEAQSKDAVPRFYIKGNRYLDWLSNKAPDDRRSNARCFSVHCSVKSGYELFSCLDRLRQHVDLPVDYVRLRYTDWNFRLLSIETMPLTNKLKHIDYFPLFYAVEAMVSRGGPLCDHFFKEGSNDYIMFMNLVIKYYNEDIEAQIFVNGNMPRTVAALEQMAAIVDRKALTVDAKAVFKELYRQNKFNLVAELKPDLEKQGYMRVRKVIVTPSRLIYSSPELLMGHRVLRKMGADNMLRVVFRDENNSKLYNLPAALIKSTVGDTMTNGVIVGQKRFTYVASSSSQLRDHGCYFLAGTDEEVCNFCDTLGDFTVEGISKMMSRLALCFTQGIPLTMELPSHLACDDYDYEGGADTRGKAYTFSDGCGRMTQHFAKEISESLKLDRCVPSVVQFRFRGYKGILYVDNHIDHVLEIAQKLDKPPDNNMWYEKNIFMRASQLKFVGPPERNIEVVKVSAPIAMSLNKPLINIMDQTSAMQGPLVHERMRNRIFALLEDHVQSVIKALVNEPAAHLVLAEFPQYIAYERLTDFIVTEEPFFQSMLRSSAQVGLFKLLDKMQIRIPSTLGRMMFGRVDDSGILQYGQVFVQYSVNVRNKYPIPGAERIVLKGPIMVSKNPNVVAGDVRIYEAVDLPCLHHYNDVIIFPQSGPRPEPDEMAGSDLDGDEYSVFWDPELYLDHSEDAFDFTPDAAPAAPDLSFDDETENVHNWKINWWKFRAASIVSFSTYIASDSIGSIASAHLANSDLFGIESEVCASIARKHSQAVDLPKSGRCPSPLLAEWKETEDGRMLQPEKVELFPEFANARNHPSYTSTRLLGELHRRVRDLNNLFDFESIANSAADIVVDESLVVEGDEKYYKIADDLLLDYKTAIENLCHSYGIRNEGELFSGKFTALKRSLGDRNDDMSSFNTEHVIEESLMNIYATYRKGFFDEFGGFEENTQVSESRMYIGVKNDCFRAFCSHPTLEMRQKASAYYRIAYTRKTHLSFPWVVADVLATNRQTFQQRLQHCTFSLSPLTDRIRDHIEFACSQTELSRFENFKLEMQANRKSKNKTAKHVAKFVAIIPGLAELVFFFRMWAFKNDIQCIPTFILDAIMIAHGLGDIPCLEGGTFMRGASAEEDLTPDKVLNVRDAYGGLGKHFWSLICAMTLQKFADRDELPLGSISSEALSRRQLDALRVAAISTFFPIAVSRRMNSLPGSIKSDDRNRVPMKKMEYESIYLQVPQECDGNFNNYLKKVAERCEVYIDFCDWNVHNTKQRSTIIKPAGTFFAVNKFRNLLEIKPDLSIKDFKERVHRLRLELFYKVKFYADEKNSLEATFDFAVHGKTVDSKESVLIYLKN